MVATKKDRKKIIDDLLTRGVTNIVDKDHLKKALNSSKKLRVKLGVDPTGPKLHIGRAFAIWKLRQFQELGHHIIFIIGDFTAQIGDSSDKSAERQPLTISEIKKNMKTYKKQIGKILDLDKVEIRYNSEWLGKLSPYDLLRETMNFTVAQMIERDNYWERFKAKKPIGLHEILYPIFQGYDSVAIKADVEIGGNDQLFNLLAGRTIQKKHRQKEQDIMTFDLLEGTDGRKMSTSYGNCIYIEDEPNEMYGKVMSIKDELIERYFVLATDLPMSDIKRQLKKGPRRAKGVLAFEIVKRYHGERNAQKAEEDFVKKFVKKETPDDIREVKFVKAVQPVADILVDGGLTSSKSEARRLIEQGAVKIDGNIVYEREAVVCPVKGMVIQVGKRKFIKVK